MSKWVKCSERMPEELEDVLVSDGRSVEVMYLRLGLWYVTSPDSAICGDEVTHWMPLPEPPEV